MLPGADLGEKRDGRTSERAGAVGVICWREGPCAGSGEVLGFNEGNLEMGSQA